MTKKLIKNLISLTLMCTIVVSLCVALLAAGYNNNVIGASLNLETLFNDSVTGSTSDQLPTHTCIEDGVRDDIDPWSYLELNIICYNSKGVRIGGDFFAIYNDNYLTGTVEFGLFSGLEWAQSTHKVEIYCENVSDFTTLVEYVE